MILGGDESIHFAFTRGTSFRKTFARIGEVRSIIPQYVNVMALTATASKTMRRDIIQKLGMTNTKVINISPEKRNVFLAVKDKPSIENFVEKVSVILLHERQSSNKL